MDAVMSEYGDLLKQMRFKKQTHKAASNVLMVQALDALETVIEKNKQLERRLEDCNNELCYKCGKHKEAHLGACDYCKWK